MKNQSFASNKKISSTLALKTFASFNASTVEGIYLPASIAFIVCRDTPIRSASSACVMLSIARCTRRLFFMNFNTVRVELYAQHIVKSQNKKDEDSVHVVNQCLEKIHVVHQHDSQYQ